MPVSARPLSEQADFCHLRKEPDLKGSGGHHLAPGQAWACPLEWQCLLGKCLQSLLPLRAAPNLLTAHVAPWERAPPPAACTVHAVTLPAPTGATQRPRRRTEPHWRPFSGFPGSFQAPRLQGPRGWSDGLVCFGPAKRPLTLVPHALRPRPHFSPCSHPVWAGPRPALP